MRGLAHYIAREGIWTEYSQEGPLESEVGWKMHRTFTHGPQREESKQQCPVALDICRVVALVPSLLRDWVCVVLLSGVGMGVREGQPAKIVRPGNRLGHGDLHVGSLLGHVLRSSAGEGLSTAGLGRRRS